MQTFICEICGDAYIGTEHPADCPFCGAPKGFIRKGHEAEPIVNKDLTPTKDEKAFLLETLSLENKASEIYRCMSTKTSVYEVKAMYKRLVKIEAEHATIVKKILKLIPEEVPSETCSDEDVENFKETIKLEEHASDLYADFAKKSTTPEIKLLFTALTQAERGHIELIKKYL